MRSQDKEQEPSPEQRQEFLEQEQERARQEQFQAECRQVQALLHSEGFQVLQARWSLLLQSYRDELQDMRKSVEEIRVLQGRIACFADIKFVLESYLEKETA